MPSPPAPLLAVVALLAALAGPAPAAAAPAAAAPGVGENLFRGPARCVLGYLEAVRLAGPHGRVLPLGSTRALERSYGAARALTAPRALEEVDRSVARGGDPPLAPWREAARGFVLESFSLLEVRRAPLGAAAVLVRERIRRGVEAALELTLSEYLVARVGGEWKVIDRRVGARFQDHEVTERYAAWFDRPQTASSRP